MHTPHSTSGSESDNNLAHVPTPTASAIPSRLPRRAFLKLSGITLATTAFSSLPAMAGPFAPSDFEKLIPADKKLRPEWVQSLFARGESTVYRKQRLYPLRAQLLVGRNELLEVG